MNELLINLPSVIAVVAVVIAGVSLIFTMKRDSREMELRVKSEIKDHQENCIHGVHINERSSAMGRELKEIKETLRDIWRKIDEA